MNFDTPVLDEFFESYRKQIPSLDALIARHNQATEADAMIALYDALYPLFEQLMWQSDDFEHQLKIYQSLFREQETLIAQTAQDDRHDFILAIPIADRPQHLQSCLESIYQLCHLYAYGGKKQGVYTKIRVIVAEDSQLQKNIDEDIRIVQQFNARGLQVEHVGQDEQYDLMQSIPAQRRANLKSILTDQPRDRFYRKGQAANRNLSYLKMLQLTQSRSKTLYYLVDSDQLFQVNRYSGEGEQAVAAVNYFYYIDRIFRRSDTLMLTGKLVGDPPVSPSVMAVNFIDDVIHFLKRLATLDEQQPCCFHDASEVAADAAAYHDMSGLFGFKQAQQPFDYACPLSARHDHLACLDHFGARLNAFFYGEHLTRKTCFQYGEAFDTLSAARTIYPGNYIVRYEGLKHVIAFGDLRLRMSGPTAGRLIQAEIGTRFASANLPMLHQRTQAKNLQDDFRPGVEKTAQRIELSDEFERQFFGDLMLFSVEKLAALSADGKTFEKQKVAAMLDCTEQQLLQQYQRKHEAVVARSQALKACLNNASAWWNQSAAARQAVINIEIFIENIDHNFGENAKAWQQILSPQHRATRKQQILQAIMDYKKQRAAWDSLF